MRHVTCCLRTSDEGMRVLIYNQACCLASCVMMRSNGIVQVMIQLA